MNTQFEHTKQFHDVFLEYPDDKKDYRLFVYIGLGIAVLVGIIVYLLISKCKYYAPPHYTGTTLDKVSPCEKGDNGVFKVEKGTKEIGLKAFYQCKNITTVILPQSLTTIASDAFKECSNLESIILPDSLTFIGADAFYNCRKLKTINIPLSVKNINNNPFSGCCLDVEVAHGHKKYYEHGGCLVDKTNMNLISYTGNKEQPTIPNNVRIIGESAFASNGRISKIDMTGCCIHEIRSFAFADCYNIESIIFPDSLENIGDNNPFMGIHYNNVERVEINSNYVNDKGYLIDMRNKTLISYLGKESTLKFYRLENNIDSIGAFSLAWCNFILSFDNKRKPKYAKNAFFGCNDYVINKFNSIK